MYRKDGAPAEPCDENVAGWSRGCGLGPGHYQVAADIRGQHFEDERDVGLDPSGCAATELVTFMLAPL